jgi:hypothetical protein
VADIQAVDAVAVAIAAAGSPSTWIITWYNLHNSCSVTGEYNGKEIRLYIYSIHQQLLPTSKAKRHSTKKKWNSCKYIIYFNSICVYVGNWRLLRKLKGRILTFSLYIFRELNSNVRLYYMLPIFICIIIVIVGTPASYQVGPHTTQNASRLVDFIVHLLYAV